MTENQFSWETFTRQFGGTLNEGEFEVPKLRKNNDSSPQLIPLTQLSTIKFLGTDASSFLDSQLTTQISSLRTGQLHQSGYCNPKGRLIATPYLHKTEEAIYALIPTDLREIFSQHISKFVMRSKVTISTAENKVLFGIISESNQDVASYISKNNATYLALDDTKGIVITNTENASEVSKDLLRHFQLRSHQVWRKNLIDKGIVNIDATSTSVYLPQMIGLDKRGGVSFDKGCYPGQEIVARTRYLGKTKRELYRFESPGGIFAGESIKVKNGDKLGSILNVATSDSGDRVFGLAVLRIGSQTEENVVSESGSKIIITEKF